MGAICGQPINWWAFCILFATSVQCGQFVVGVPYKLWNTRLAIYTNWHSRAAFRVRGHFVDVVTWIFFPKLRLHNSLDRSHSSTRFSRLRSWDSWAWKRLGKERTVTKSQIVIWKGIHPPPSLSSIRRRLEVASDVISRVEDTGTEVSQQAKFHGSSFYNFDTVHFCPS